MKDVDAMTKKEKQKLLDAAEKVEGFQTGCITLLILAGFIGLLYGMYCVGYQEGGYAMRHKAVNYVQCLHDSGAQSLEVIHKCYDDTVGS